MDTLDLIFSVNNNNTTVKRKINLVVSGKGDKTINEHHIVVRDLSSVQLRENNVQNGFHVIRTRILD